MFDHHVVFLCAFSETVLRIRMFLDLLHPDPLVRGMDPDPDPSITKQK
jgi:hypothetical protein